MSNRVRELLLALGEKEPSAHLAPVRARLHPSAGIAALQREIAEEIAGSLGRAAHRIEAALARLTELDRAFGEAEAREDAAEVARVAAAFNAERERAQRAILDLKIQREALGFRRHDEVARAYPVPRPKKAS